jgi:cytoskeletal protein CcmA (bactofilin family)
MFERNKNKPAATPPAAEPKASPTGAPAPREPVTSRSDAMIGPSIVIKGTVSGDEDLLVQGRVEGSIELKDNEVSVGQSGRVTADVDAKVVKIDGEVTGDIAGAEKVVISKSGNVRGNIVAPRVTLEDGAKFKGSIDMDPGEATTGTVSLASQRGSDGPAEDLAGTPLEQKSG